MPLDPALPSFVPGGAPADLTVALVAYRSLSFLPRCFETLRVASAGLRVRVVVVDNASGDGCLAWLAAHAPDAVVIANTQNVGFGRANNQVLPLLGEEPLLLLNTDAFVAPDSLRAALAALAADPALGLLGVRLVDENGLAAPAARRFPGIVSSFLHKTGLKRGDPHHVELVADPATTPGAPALRPCDWVVGCFYLVRGTVLRQVGLFDPRYFLYFEEVDHCLRTHQAGWGIACLATTTVVHVGGGSAAQMPGFGPRARQVSVLQVESELLYWRKHRGRPGLLLALGLGLLADTVLALKAWAKARLGRGAAGDAAVHARNARQWWTLARATGFGTRPTR
ncbi:glycosyltransferase [Aquariibacter albus]|uniref:Glycosyltransferase n=1 Tax=Aquariibacter albus TaxID=2759899 RepID=A0A839HKH4_9BURK|nr:glycosyltransferase [Aquariibacter albus]MBB1162573.1 glycosyltransferase [Aquariibacter albus]